MQYNVQESWRGAYILGLKNIQTVVLTALKKTNPNPRQNPKQNEWVPHSRTALKVQPSKAALILLCGLFYTSSAHCLL